MPAFFVSVIWLLFAIAVVGLLIWLIKQYVPMDANVARVFDAVVVIVCVLVVVYLVYWMLVSLLGAGPPTIHGPPRMVP